MHIITESELKDEQITVINRLLYNHTSHEIIDLNFIQEDKSEFYRPVNIIQL